MMVWTIIAAIFGIIAAVAAVIGTSISVINFYRRPKLKVESIFIFPFDFSKSINAAIDREAVQNGESTPSGSKVPTHTMTVRLQNVGKTAAQDVSGIISSTWPIEPVEAHLKEGRIRSVGNGPGSRHSVAFAMSGEKLLPSNIDDRVWDIPLVIVSKPGELHVVTYEFVDAEGHKAKGYKEFELTKL